jgi:hypothetical protein
MMADRKAALMGSETAVTMDDWSVFSTALWTVVKKAGRKDDQWVVMKAAWRDQNSAVVTVSWWVA